MRKSTTASNVEAPVADEKKEVKKTSRRKKVVAPVAEETAVEDVAGEVAAPEVNKAEKAVQEAPAAEAPTTEHESEKRVKNTQTQLPPIPRNAIVRDIVDLWNARIPLLNDQQVQQLTLKEAQDRHLFFEAILAQVLDYDIVLSDTNMWLELLVGHTSSHSDPRVNARLMFERQLEFISKMMKKRGGRFMIMSETYEEIDRFACQQEPTNYQQADFTDPALCRNVAARLAKRLILSQQRENRLRIEGITSESHHASFADPAIIRRMVELFAEGKKILLLTNDASVAIRSLGMCDDLQRVNSIDDETWDKLYAPIRPMACTMDDLKQLDSYTRQYHFLQSAAGAAWMQDLTTQPKRDEVPHLKLDENAFRPGDKHERRSDREDRLKQEQQKEQRQQELQKLDQQRQQLKEEKQKLDQQRNQMKQEQQKLQQEQQKLQQEQQRQRQEQQKEQRQHQERQRKSEPLEPAAQSPAQVPVQSSAQPSAPAQAPSSASNDAVATVAAAAETPVATETPVVVAPVQEPADASEGESQATTVDLPAFSPEDKELLSNPAPKKRTHRGGRRRGGSKKAEN
ncbi:MAG: hypothetical protein KBT20_02580 [Bacteroidales bacterium]|nr:hypothetical protein [Candidatus Liminaster caballi]